MAKNKAKLGRVSGGGSKKGGSSALIIVMMAIIFGIVAFVAYHLGSTAGA